MVPGLYTDRHHGGLCPSLDFSGTCNLVGANGVLVEAEIRCIEAYAQNTRGFLDAGEIDLRIRSSALIGLTVGLTLKLPTRHSAHLPLHNAFLTNGLDSNIMDPLYLTTHCCMLTSSSSNTILFFCTS